jgi:diguanylate cyclase (GGDEF)-like protein
MTIPTKIKLILSLLAALFMGAYLLIQQIIIYPTFESLEQQFAKDDIDRLETIIFDTLNNLDRQLYDISVWDDTYEFIRNANETYLNSNLVGDTFPNLNIDLAYFLDPNRQVVWAETYQFADDGFEVNTSNEYIAESISLLTNELDKFQIFSEKKSNIIHGLFFQEGIPIAFSIRLIFNSDHEGPPRGYVIFGKKLDAFFVEDIERKFKKPFEIERIQITATPINDFSDFKYSIVPLTKQQLSISKIYLVDNIEALQISTKIDRKITQSGLSVLNYTLFYLLLITILMMSVVTIILKYSIFDPLIKLKSQIQYISKHKDYSLRSQVKSNDEIGIFSMAFNNMLDIIKQNNRDLVEANAKLSKLTLIDPLTQIANRLGITNKLQIEWMASYRQQTPLSILMVDIDYFKTYNDDYGHQKGDECLIQIAKILNNNMNRPRDFVGRFGGEEFILILPETNSKAALKIAKHIQLDIAKSSIEHKDNKVSLYVTVSIGVATQISLGGQSAQRLIYHSDNALYMAKNSGRNRIYADAELTTNAFKTHR